MDKMGPPPRFEGRGAFRIISSFLPYRLPLLSLFILHPHPCSQTVLHLYASRLSALAFVRIGCTRGPPTVDGLAARAAAPGYKRG